MKGRDPLVIGYIAKVRGLQGELGVVQHFRQSEALCSAKEVWLQAPEATPRSFRIQSFVAGGKGGYLRCDGIGDREAAERWRGATVLVERDQTPALQPGEYYLADLVGCVVEHAAKKIGKVTQVVSHPSVDSAVVELTAGGTSEVPILDDWIEEVDTTARRVVLTSLDGLID